MAYDASGATAIEFAFVAPFFFLFIMVIFEVAIMLFAGVLMDNAAISAGRAVRTGQVQTSDNPEEEFKKRVCDSVSVMLACDGIQYDVRTFDKFRDISFPEDLNEDGMLRGADFDPGESGDIMVVRIAYRYGFVAPFVADIFGDEQYAGTRLLIGSTVFQNEPYDVEYGGW